MKKTKAKFGHLLRTSAWKQRGPILVLALQKFVNYLLTYLDTYPLTYSPGTHTRLHSFGIVIESANDSFNAATVFSRDRTGGN